MQAHQQRSQTSQLSKEVPVAGQRQSGKIRPEKLPVTFSIRRAVKYSVGVIENTFRADFSFGWPAKTIRHELAIQPFTKLFDEFRAQVRAAAILVHKQVLIGQLAIWVEVERKNKIAFLCRRGVQNRNSIRCKKVRERAAAFDAADRNKRQIWIEHVLHQIVPMIATFDHRLFVINVPDVEWPKQNRFYGR